VDFFLLYDSNRYTVRKKRPKCFL